MKTIVIPFEHEWMEDIERIVQILADRDYDCSPEDAAYMWNQYSDSMAAGWMMLDEDDEQVFNQIKYYVMKYSGELNDD